MPKILCTIPGAPEEIGGLKGLVKFSRTDAGLVADVDADEAANFTAISGYSLLEDAKKPATDPDADAKEKADLLARAAAVKPALEVDSRWKLPRLRAEVERAEKLAAEGAGE